MEFADVRILAIGVWNKPRSTFLINKNARRFLQPPGISGSSCGMSSQDTPIDETTSSRNYESAYKLSMVKCEYVLLACPVREMTSLQPCQSAMNLSRTLFRGVNT